MTNKLMFVRKLSLFLLAGTAFAGTAFAGENAKVKSIVDSKYYDDLVKNGTVAKYRDDGSEGFFLLPESDYSDVISKTMITKNPKNYPYTYEGLYLLNKKELLEKGNSGKNTVTIADVSTVIRSISKMQGMKYYSTTKKKECVLYEKTYMIAGPDDKTPIADQNTGSADGQVSYCLQDDNSFGINTYKLSYRQNEESLWCNFSILDKMGIGPFKAIYPGKMIINILVIDCDDDLLLYLCTDTDSVKFPGIKGQITNSMSARMEAVYKWFKTQF